MQIAKQVCVFKGLHPLGAQPKQIMGEKLSHTHFADLAGASIRKRVFEFRIRVPCPRMRLLPSATTSMERPAPNLASLSFTTRAG